MGEGAEDPYESNFDNNDNGFNKFSKFNDDEY